ncbi:hypothetical protein AVEN_243887-1 [Araneus ventricosus]|uniref:Uncharacterized protein n=1 Tax=Araneus ventricosus TaxID=182803 RepID=A0A4Y2N736_ARAVE|nr:hypothetical protein AVEN_243887-1 [Araneus ventricosus]
MDPSAISAQNLTSPKRASRPRPAFVAVEGNFSDRLARYERARSVGENKQRTASPALGEVTNHIVRCSSSVLSVVCTSERDAPLSNSTPHQREDVWQLRMIYDLRRKGPIHGGFLGIRVSPESRPIADPYH